MALLRHRSSERTTRSSRPASNTLTRQILHGLPTSINQQHNTSHADVNDEPDSEPDFNEAFIQSIEELSPEKEHVAGELANIAQYQPLEREPDTPSRPIKIERISNTLSDIYDASPHGHVHKTAHLERRRTSRSTAQLTTPASSPDCKCSNLCLTGKYSIVKSEVGQPSNGRYCDADGSCTSPADSSPGRIISFKVSRRNGNPTTPQRSPSGRFQRNANGEDSCDSCEGTEDHSRATTSVQRSISQTNHSGKHALVSNRKSNAFISTCLATREIQSERSKAGYPQFLSPVKDHPLSSKRTTPPVPGRSLSTPPSTPSGTRKDTGASSKNKTCCKLMCLECTPKNLQKEYGLGPPERRPNLSRFKSPSVCPSVSSFGTDEDIPPSSRQLQEVRKALAENRKAFASDQLSEISPSLRYKNSSARLGNYAPSSSSIENAINRYGDLEVPSFKRKNPSRSVLGTVSNVMSNDDEMLLRGILRRSYNLEDNLSIDGEESQRGARHSIRSCSIFDKASRKIQSLEDQASQRRGEDEYHGGEGEDSIEHEPEDDMSSTEENGRGGPLELNHAGSTMRKFSTQALPGVRNSYQGTKRRREDFDEEQPTWFCGEDVGGEDDLVEIDGDVFRASENRRKKRHKTPLKDANTNSGVKSPAPKEEQTEKNREIFMETQGLGTRGFNTTETTVQEPPLCDYYMNTYWEHGRASDGRRARDGFTSYLDFKEYCKKNKQPTDDRCVLTYKKDLKHYLLCEYHACLRQDLFRVAWNFEHNPGFSFKSSNKDEETRRLQNEAIGNAPSPGSASRGVGAVAAAAADAEMVHMIGEILKGIGTSHAADVAQLAKSKKKLENEVKGLKRRLARIQKR